MIGAAENQAALSDLISDLRVFVFAALILCAIIFFVICFIVKSRYQKSEYYAQTKMPYLRMLFNKGSIGEYYTYKYLKPLKGYRRFLFNCYLPKDDGTTTELDVIMLHESGIYVFESKNYSGWIFGSENQQHWTQTLPKGKGRLQKSHFLNPIIQNKVHLKWLQNYLEDNNVPQFYSYIVFSDRCTLKDITLTSGNHHVINRYDILPAVRKNVETAENNLSKEEINTLFEKLHPLTQIDNAQKNVHVENIRQKHTPSVNAPNNEKASVSAGIKTCPRCGGKMVYRTAKRGEQAGNHFWGCSNFPNCRYIENINE